MKKSLINCLVLLFCLILTACGAGVQEETLTESDDVEAFAAPETLTVMALKGPSGVGMAYLMEKYAADANYNYSVVGAPDEVVAALASGTADIAAIPTNLAAKLYAKTEGDVVLLAVETYGTLYLCENGDNIHSIEDLAGRQIYLAGQGANPQYVLEYLLKNAGVEAELVYCSEHAEAAALLASGEIDCAFLPEPNLTATLAKNENLRMALDCNDLWREATGQELCLGCIAVRREFAEAYPDYITSYLNELEESISYAQNNPAEAGVLCEKYGIIPSAALAEAAIPNCQLCCLTGEEMAGAVSSFYDVLLTADPASLGGALPGADFYYDAQ